VTEGGSTFSRYSGGAASNSSQLGIETQRTAMPCAASLSAAAAMSPTSEPLAMRIKPGFASFASSRI
jgi:hypothetical protein